MNQFPERNPHLAWRKIDGDTVIISPEDSHVHELNETASLIWQHADGKHSVDDIAKIVSAGYEVALDAARKDVNELIEILSSKGLLAAPKSQEVSAGA